MSTEVTDPPADPPRAETDPSLSIPWWTRGDTNAFFGLGVQHPGQRPDADRV